MDLISLLVFGVLVVPVLLFLTFRSHLKLGARVDAMERELAQLRTAAASRSVNAERGPAAQALTAHRDATPLPPAAADRPTASARVLPEDAQMAQLASGPPISAPQASATRDPARFDPAAAGQQADPGFDTAPRPGFAERAGIAIKGWFTSGNVPVKVGMLVLLAGVAALLKYASDQGWLHAPIELRLAGIAAVALVALVFGWLQRGVRREFALALQGGAIGVLLLTVFAAAKLYALIPLSAAFALSIVLVAGLGLLAALQDALALAVLGLLAGFLAPIWLSGGSGDHVVLFGWYALLNAAIFALAWVRAWKLLNLLGFVFTWGIGTAWGVLDYRPDQFWHTEPFLLLFFAFYLSLPVLHARLRPDAAAARIDGWLLFGTPLAAFTAQAALLLTRDLDASRLQLAFCALALAAIYAALAFGMRHLARSDQHRSRYEALVPAHALLAVGFATLAVPLACSARVTASVFALEGAALLWLGLRQHQRFTQWAGLGLQLAAAVAFALGVGNVGGYLIGNEAAGVPIHMRLIGNATFMGALVIAAAGFASAWALHAAGNRRWAAGAYVWAMLWWVGNAAHEIDRFVAGTAQPDALLAFAALTGWLAAEVLRRRPAAALAWTALVAMAVAIPLAFAQSGLHRQPFGGAGSWAWGLFLVLGVRSLLCLSAGPSRAETDARTQQVASWTQVAWWLVWPTALMLAGIDVASRFVLGSGWQWAIALLPWLAVALLALQRWAWLAWPLGIRFDARRLPFLCSCFGVLALGWLAALSNSGASAPLPWVALLNPLDLVQFAVLAAAARWSWSAQVPTALQRVRTVSLAAAGFLLVTTITLRAVHHWGGLRWNIDLFDHSLTQASLTIVWSVVGVAAWVAGSGRGQRALWLAGAVLMGIVLAKLVLVDRQHLGNLLGIGSFIAFGLLCTLVGYIAPAPPRRAAAEFAWDERLLPAAAPGAGRRFRLTQPSRRRRSRRF